MTTTRTHFTFRVDTLTAKASWTRAQRAAITAVPPSAAINARRLIVTGM